MKRTVEAYSVPIYLGILVLVGVGILGTWCVIDHVRNRKHDEP